MKMRLFSSFILSLCSVMAFSQTILYQAETSSRVVQDPQTVLLEQGFTATSDVSNPFVAQLGAATENPGGGPADSNAGANNPSGTITSSQDQKFHDTKGNIEVTGAGQLQFTLPIALPPGVKSVAPQINLTYTSGSTNGIAGYGWSIAGITAVSRISKNIEKNGVTKAIQLDYSDHYSFNGQRLILKSGEYGKDGAEYVTEKYSNVKIKSLGTKNGVPGPMLFHVTFEDGSQAWYGDTVYDDSEHYSAARTSLEYNIVKWMDAQGNYITYEYEKNLYLTAQPVGGGDVTKIKRIKWGGNETLNKPHFNEIIFNYNVDRTFKEISYHKGFYYNQDKLLNSVSVLTNGHQFRRYALEYTDNGTGYQFVNKVIEYNSNDEPANPVNIEYEPSSTANEEVVRQNDIATNNTKKYGDFNMDGITDYLEYIPNPGNSPNGPVGVIYFKSSLYEDVPVMPLQYELSRFTAAEFAKATPVTFKKNNFVKNQAGIIIPHKVSTSEANKPNYEFLVYSVDLQNSKFNLEYSKVITYDQYVIGAPMDDDLPLPGCNYSQVTLSDITAYDYNGDGISELLFGFKRTRTCINTNPGTGIDYSGKSTSKTATSSSEEGLPYIQPSVNASNTDPGSDNPDVPENDDTTGNITPGSSMTSFYASVLFNLDENVSVDQSIYKYEEGTGTAKKIQLADFNGDGIQDIVLLNTSNGTITRVFNIINNSDGTFDTVNVGAFSGQTLGGISSAALYGDFNGDSKIDVLVPQANKSSNWNLYVSDGNKLNAYYINNFVFYLAGTETISSGVHNTFFESGCTYGVSRYLQYNTADLDGDGKSEIVVSNVLVNDHKWNAHHDQEWTKTHVTVYSVNKLSGALNTAVIYNPSYPSGLSTITLLSNIDNPAAIQTNSSVNFYRTRDWLHTFNEKVIPFSNLTLNRDNQQVILLGRPDDCSGVVGCPYNHVLKYNYPYVPAIARVKFIKQGGITTEIAYKELDSKTAPNFYKPVKPEQFPYFELAKIPLSLAVSQLKQYTTAGTLIQDFRYRGFLSHFTGRGVIGFRQSARSSLYAEGFENSKIWTGTEMDPLMDGVPVKEWSIRTNNENLIFPADISENNSQLLSYKSTNYKTDKLLSGQVVNTVTNIDKPKVVMATVPVSTVTKDFLTNTVTTGTILYDSYYLPSKTTKNINGSFSTTINTFNYIHNPSGIGKDYFIGRLEVEELQHTAYNTTNRETQHYTYQDNLPKTIINAVGNNLSDNLTEEYKYDGFGNITEKKIISGVDSQIRLNKTQYDDKGRFVIKKTDNIGLETNITYNDWGQILTQTDPIGNTLINTYDFWGKVLTSKTNLEGTTTYEYIRDSQKNTIVAEYESDGNISRKFTNILGQEYKTQTKAFEQGKFISVYRVFDALGRKIKESEPYFDQAAEELPANIQWNLFVYDDTVFPAKVTTLFFNGKTTETSISGTVTTVKEINGYGRTTSKTVDALGNVVAATDKGGTINFTYDSRGNQLTAQYGTNVVATKYDVWDRKSEFNDPSNGIYKYEYNGFGQPTKIISPKGIKEYGYNSLGQLITQKELSTADGGQATNKLISFTYDDKGRMISKTGISKGKSYSANTFYDSQGRRLSLSESSNGKYFIQKGIAYDNKGRVTSYEKQLYSSGALTKVQIENNYSAWNGELYQVKDKVSGKILWELQNTNAKGQVLTAKLGAAGINNTYDANGFLTNVNHSSQVKPSILQISYSFDAIRNELNYRKTEGDFAIEEKFDYDDNNRLINWTDPVTKVKPSAKRNVYDINGRILENDQVGTIKYGNSAKVYQPTGMTLNAAGTQNYNNDLIQSIVYNENNDPVFIDGQKGDVAFQYGLTGMRQRVTYGGNFNADGEGKFTKFYSEDGSYEIQVNNSTGAEKHILYIGGTPYESNIVYVKNYGETTGSFKFLHKDYIGSILAISDEAGNKVEQRHFDAWGNLTHLKIANQSVITDREQINKFIASGGLILDRGYTSHEYFPEVGIIHMNGRLYDPLLRRFLNADENIQDPYNTQNYNKYGYVMNNPLLFNDPSGEYIFGVESALLAAVIIGAIVGAASYVVSAIITGQKFSLVGLFQATVFGAISGAVTFGIGELFAPALQSAVQVSDAALKVMAQSGLALAQATVHGIAQGTLSLMQGGSFHQALLSGALGSLGASAFGAVGKGFANQVTGKVLFGAISGGIGAELSGGNFWQGAVIGGIVAGLNHGLHEMDSTHPSDGDKPKKGKTGKAPSKAKNVQKLVKTASQVATVLDIVGDTPGSRSTLKLIGKPAGKAFPILETTSNVMEYANGDISGQRLTYRTVGVGTSIVVGAEAGSVVPGYGSLIGAVAGGIFGGAELLYDKFNQYVKPVMQQKVNHFNNQIKFSR